MANAIELIVSKFVSDLSTIIRRDIVRDLHSMSVTDLMALSLGGSDSSAPIKRGPGRPKKVAAADGQTVRNGKGAKRRGRRTNGDAQALYAQITSVLTKHPEGLSSEQLQKALGVEKKELPRAFAMGFEEGKITKTGEKRGTRYFWSEAAGKGKKGKVT